jgi:hypothetical protein
MTYKPILIQHNDPITVDVNQIIKSVVNNFSDYETTQFFSEIFHQLPIYTQMDVIESLLGEVELSRSYILKDYFSHEYQPTYTHNFPYLHRFLATSRYAEIVNDSD